MPQGLRWKYPSVEKSPGVDPVLESQLPGTPGFVVPRSRRQRNRGSASPTPSPTFSVRCCSLVPAAKPQYTSRESVQLVGYCKRGSFLYSQSPDMEDGPDLEDLRISSDAPRNPECSVSLANGVPTRMDNEAYERFVQEANARCATSTRDQFADFVRKNREAFAQLLEDSASRLSATGSSLKLPSSFGDRDSGVFFVDQDPWNTSSVAATASSSESNLRSLRDDETDDGSKSLLECDLQALLLRKCPPSSWRYDPLFRASGLSDAISEPQLRPRPRPFSDFPRDASGTLSMADDPTLHGRMSSSFHFTTTRTRFEYCGETNTFRFNNQQVSRSLESSYDSVSESEDEDEESPDGSTAIDLPSEESSIKEDIADTGAAPLPLSESVSGRVARELLTTEQTYVGVLHLLDQVFAFRVDQENRAQAMFPPGTTAAMFSNLKSLYQLHHNFLLPRLQDRLSSWYGVPALIHLARCRVTA